MNDAAAPYRKVTGHRRATDDARIVRLVEALREANADCQIELPWGVVIRICADRPLGVPPPKASPQFRLKLRNEHLLRSPITQLSLASAYVRGDLDIEATECDDPRATVANKMSVFQVRDHLRSGTSVNQAIRFAADLALTRPTQVNERAIRHHYSLGDDFYHTFLDPKYHFYSQCRFADDADEKAELGDPKATLIEAAERKLTDMSSNLGLEKKLAARKPVRILDIGGGWGGLAKYYRGQSNVHVTSLTISQDSANYMRENVVGRNDEVILEDLLEHRRRGYYDAVVIFGVIEHIPTYGLFCRRVWDALKPGGRLYLDASATRQKYAASAFTRRYTWQGPHSCLALPDMIEELLFHGFAIRDVRNGTRDYERTMTAWALRLEVAEDMIAERWGQYVYRAFHVFLWGGAQGFRSNRLQAYTLVAERTKDKGPRPGRLRRAGHFVASLR